MDALSLYYFSNWLYKLKIPILPKFIQILIFLLFNSYIPYQTKIGQHSKVGHRGISIIINKDAIIGKNVLIRAHVTIGKLKPNESAPIIEDGVSIGDGAKILGNINVGKYSNIGANAVVISNVPDDSTAVGVPARIISCE